MRKVAGYYRLSIEDDDVIDESNSIKNQRQLIKRYLSEETELSQYEFCEFCDDGYSGSTMNRPGMQKMLECIKNGEIHAVIVKDISRFSRDYIELGTYMEQIFPFMGIRFIAVMEHYDSKYNIVSTMGLDMAFRGLLADFYGKDVSDKVKSSLEIKRMQGDYATGLTPFGYKKSEESGDKKEQLMVVSEEAEVIRYIFELAALGNNLPQICKKLNDEGIMTPAEYKRVRKKQKYEVTHQAMKFWQAGMVRTILTNENYIGNMVYGKTERIPGGYGKRVSKPKEEWKVWEHHHEAIIDNDTFKLVQAKYNKRKAGNRKYIDYPLKGKLFCSYCRCTLKVVKHAGEKLFFYCPNKKICSKAGCMAETLSNEILENMVISEIKKQLMFQADYPAALKELHSILQKRIKEEKKGLACMQEKISKLNTQRALLFQNYHENRLNKEQWKENQAKMLQNLHEMQREEENKKKEIEQYTKWLYSSPKDWNCFFTYCGTDILTKEVIESFVDYIEIGKNRNIDIYLMFHG